MHAESPIVEFRDVSYGFTDGARILHELNFSINRGEILVLLGRSGSGKTTTLKLINGLLSPIGGAVLVEGKPTTEWEPTALRRRIGYVIQDVGLFPHFTVARNVALVPTLERWDRSRTDGRVDELLRLVHLDPQSFAARLPARLSGGQRQRVGLARALAADPPLLLLDEPFGALDPLTRFDLQRELIDLQSRLEKTMVFVTHDVREGLKLATRVALIQEGRIVFLGSTDKFVTSERAEARAFARVLDGESH